MRTMDLTAKGAAPPRTARFGLAASAVSNQSPLPCPRCESSNTKFCYYNNYNLAQPRHFCKACRRYWTHGGSLRSIPVGGATRKHSKRSRYPAATTHYSPASNSTSAASSPTRVSSQLAVSADQIATRNGQQQQQQQQMEQEEKRVWSGVNLNEANCSFSSLLDVNAHRMSGYGFGLGLTPGYEEFGFGGAGGSSVNAASGLVNPSTGTQTWQIGSGRVNAGDFFGWPDLSISMPTSDLID